MIDLAERLGVTVQMVSKIVAGKSAPRARIDQLVELGVPRDLLPEPTGSQRGFVLP